MGDFTIWNGRPNWDDRFTAIANRHPSADIGYIYQSYYFVFMHSFVYVVWQQCVILW
jgi:hypothetical protein